VIVEYAIRKGQENQERPELIGEYQPLIYADDSNLLCKTCTMEKSVDGVLYSYFGGWCRGADREKLYVVGYCFLGYGNE
jgi:hypothetical protein